MQKSNKNFIASLVLLIVLLGGIFLPFVASAYVMPQFKPQDNTEVREANGMITNHICPNTNSTDLSDGLVVRIIPCIRDIVVYATSQIMDEVVTHVANVFAALFTLAIVIFGISVVTGHTPSFSQSGIILAIKIAAIIMFANNFNGMYPMLLNALEELLNLMAKPAIEAFDKGGAWNRVSGTTSAILTCEYGKFQASETNIMNIWNLIDCYIDVILGGIFSTTTLKMGFLGFVIGALLSNTIGLFVGFVGLYILASALMTVFRAVYIFLTSYVAFSFMVLISVIFIPTILFQSTKRFFDGWLRITISFLLQPVFVFGYLIMFLVAINITIFNGKHSLYYAIAGEDSQNRNPSNPGVVNGNFYIGEWLENVGAYKEDLALKDLARISSSETNDQLDKTPKDTKLQGMQFSRSKEAEPHDTLLGRLLDDVSKMNFFEIGIPVTVIDWEWLAKARNLERWNEIQYMPYSTDAEKAAKAAAIAKFYLDYKISVLLALLMAAIMIYIFYSLIEYLPFIGTATLGDGGILPFGAGHLTPPGANILGRSR